MRTRKWAIEGLAYLTNDADVKDDFVEDEAALRAMFELAKVCERPNKPIEIHMSVYKYTIYIFLS